MNKDLLEASKIHYKVKEWIKPMIKPGLNMDYLARTIETKIKLLSNSKNTINKGIAFPPSLSIDPCVAHCHPYRTAAILKYNDILKVDYGVEINGLMIDSAFSYSASESNQDLINAAKEGTEHGLKTMAVDMYLEDWGNEIEEIIKSYNDVYIIKNLGGHKIEKNILHSKPFLANYKKSSIERFKSGIYAVEVFTTDKPDQIAEPINEKNVLWSIKKNNKLNTELEKKLYDKYKYLPFASRWLEEEGINTKQLNNLNSLKQYPALYINGRSAQWEHTIYIDEINKKIY